ncbi:MAG: AAA family ATPase [Acidimicrobiia bacterium]
MDRGDLGGSARPSRGGYSGCSALRRGARKSAPPGWAGHPRTPPRLEAEHPGDAAPGRRGARRRWPGPGRRGGRGRPEDGGAGRHRTRPGRRPGRGVAAGVPGRGGDRVCGRARRGGEDTAHAAAGEAWAASGTPVRGLAVSAVAAGVLADESGLGSETLAKFLYEHDRRWSRTSG